jgi:glutamine---fructose-6-phosphate transaminase (isomerizing)
MNVTLDSNKFLAEINEQPRALRDTLDYYVNGEGKARLTEVLQYLTQTKAGRIIFTGMGSSYFISGMASTILNSLGIPAQAINSGELIHYQYPLLIPDTLLICISQSGESYEMIRILEKHSHQVTCIGICNETGSTLAGQSRVVLLSKAGLELMTSTKTFTATALVAIIFSLSLAGKWNGEAASRVSRIIDSVENLIETHFKWLPPFMELLGDLQYIQLVSRGPSMAAAQQGALMFMEGARNPASALLSGEFRHGPMELVKEGFRAIILAPDGETYAAHVKLAEDIIRFGGRVIFLSNKEPGVVPDGMCYLNIPCADEYFFSIPAIIPLQFIVNQCAMEKGSVPGEFVRGAKVTKIE